MQIKTVDEKTALVRSLYNEFQRLDEMLRVATKVDAEYERLKAERDRLKGLYERALGSEVG